MKQLKGSVRAVIVHHIGIANASLMTTGCLTPRSVTTMPNTPPTMLDQVGRNATQHDDASLGEIVAYVAAGLFIVYGMPWIITWAASL